MTVPHSMPTTANEARANMLYYAAFAEREVLPGAPIGRGLASIEKAKMWAAIALALPEVETQVITADDQPMVYVDPLHAIHPELTPWRQINVDPDDKPDDDLVPMVGAGSQAVINAMGPTMGPVPIPGFLYDALRDLAARYLHGFKTPTAWFKPGQGFAESQNKELIIEDGEDPGSYLITLRDRS